MKKMLMNVSKNVAMIGSLIDIGQFKDLPKEIFAFPSALRQLGLQDKATKQRKESEGYFRSLCEKKVALNVIFPGSRTPYASTFLNVGRIEETFGIAIDALMPREGDARMRPGTRIVLEYFIDDCRHTFETEVIRPLQGKFTAFFLRLPKEVKRDEKRIFRRIALPVDGKVQIITPDASISSMFVKSCSIENFTPEGMCLRVPAVSEITKNVNFLPTKLSRIAMTLPGGTKTGLISSKVCYVKPVYSSNHLLCGIKLDQVSSRDRNILFNYYNDHAGKPINAVR